MKKLEFITEEHRKSYSRLFSKKANLKLLINSPKRNYRRGLNFAKLHSKVLPLNPFLINFLLPATQLVTQPFSLFIPFTTLKKPWFSDIFRSVNPLSASPTKLFECV